MILWVLEYLLQRDPLSDITEPQRDLTGGITEPQSDPYPLFCSKQELEYLFTIPEVQNTCRGMRLRG